MPKELIDPMNPYNFALLCQDDYDVVVEGIRLGSFTFEDVIKMEGDFRVQEVQEEIESDGECEAKRKRKRGAKQQTLNAYLTNCVMDFKPKRKPPKRREKLLFPQVEENDIVMDEEEEEETKEDEGYVYNERDMLSYQKLVSDKQQESTKLSKFSLKRGKKRCRRRKRKNNIALKKPKLARGDSSGSEYEYKFDKELESSGSNSDDGSEQEFQMEDINQDIQPPLSKRRQSRPTTVSYNQDESFLDDREEIRKERQRRSRPWAQKAPRKQPKQKGKIWEQLGKTLLQLLMRDGEQNNKTQDSAAENLRNSLKTFAPELFKKVEVLTYSKKKLSSRTPQYQGIGPVTPAYQRPQPPLTTPYHINDHKDNNQLILETNEDCHSQDEAENNIKDEYEPPIVVHDKKARSKFNRPVTKSGFKPPQQQNLENKGPMDSYLAKRQTGSESKQDREGGLQNARPILEIISPTNSSGKSSGTKDRTSTDQNFEDLRDSFESNPPNQTYQLNQVETPFMDYGNSLPYFIIDNRLAEILNLGPENLRQTKEDIEYAVCRHCKDINIFEYLKKQILLDHASAFSQFVREQIPDVGDIIKVSDIFFTLRPLFADEIYQPKAIDMMTQEQRHNLLDEIEANIGNFYPSYRHTQNDQNVESRVNHLVNSLSQGCYLNSSQNYNANIYNSTPIKPMLHLSQQAGLFQNNRQRYEDIFNDEAYSQERERDRLI
ncbi:hypothetical protein FGO68_gene3529 [Halteria grandinella]|uniref:Uncharacterized protein n=1 Tax=Halteria grandinella TaxID=5974 RepID=A0A8J8P3E9_HALGN|nr:hypothetical protein FGO68_gene3529 [Halteria grandinella]